MRTLLPLLLVALVAFGDENLDSALVALRRIGTETEVQAILALGESAEGVRGRLLAGVRVPAERSGWIEVESPAMELYLPKSALAGSERMPLVVHLHGGVSRPDFSRVSPTGFGQWWSAAAEEEGFLLLLPQGKQDLVWWSEAGVANLRACIREAKRRGPVDDERITVTGFSDGGSGCFHLAMASPRGFAGFLPMNGHPAVAARASGKQLYLRNLAMSPLFVAMTQDDPLYPALSVLPHLESAMEQGAPMTLLSYPRGGHTPSYFEEQRETLLRFLTGTVREREPAAIDWWCADVSTGQVAWAEVLEIGGGEGDAPALPDVNVMSTPGRVRIGVTPDRDGSAAGVTVAEVSEGMPAAAMGMKVRDRIVAVQGSEVKDLGDLLAALAEVSHGASLRITVEREGKQRTLETLLPAFVSEPYYRRMLPTARLSARAAEGRLDLTLRNVRRARFQLPPSLFGVGPVTVTANGKPAACKTVTIPLEESLRRYAQDPDPLHLSPREILVD
ncbi:MAG: PDZ domain-containing protein [Planctomycetes bacterium]|nr:PDZ domain-containing protein [Planctomycetota bacterium]